MKATILFKRRDERDFRKIEVEDDRETIIGTILELDRRSVVDKAFTMVERKPNQSVMEWLDYIGGINDEVDLYTIT